MRGLLVAGMCALAFLGAACVQKQVETDMGVANQAQDVAATSTLRTAMVAASGWAAGNGSMAGFNAAAGASVEPAIQWVDGGAATVGKVSIRGVSATDMVLVTKAAGGDPLCLGVSSGAQSMGKVDAQSAAACTGGW